LALGRWDGSVELWDVAGDSPDRVIVGPGSLDVALATLRQEGQIHYKGASSQLLFSDYGATRSTPSIIWRVSGNAFQIVRRYSDDAIESRTASIPPSSCEGS
jgi:hypothetical protein